MKVSPECQSCFANIQPLALLYLILFYTVMFDLAISASCQQCEDPSACGCEILW